MTTAVRMVQLVRYIFPDLRIYARARDSQHADELTRSGAHIVVPELVATGVKLAGSIFEEDAAFPSGRPEPTPEDSGPAE